ncbi:MAG: orotate phosphoribosyltransferase [Candidatus Thorarchaeota archaeon]|jgi:orotate phosphoribosyltransferase
MTETSKFQVLKRDIMNDIYQKKMLLTSERDRAEGWKLISGLWSPFYIQLRLISSFPYTLSKVGQAMTQLIKEKAPHVNKLVGIAFAGVPIATAVSLESKIPAVHTRKLTGVKSEEDLQNALQSYGQHTLVEGVLEDGDSLCLVDDLVTGLTSKVTARAQVNAELDRRGVQNATCDDIAVLVDRQQGASAAAHKAGMKLHSLIGFVDEGLPLLKETMPEKEHKLVSDYLADPQSFQK